MTNADGPSEVPPAASDTDQQAAFEEIEWEHVSPTDRSGGPERTVFAFGLVLLAAVYLYHRSTGELYLVLSWAVGPEDWLLLLAVVVGVAFGLVPRVGKRGRREVRRIAQRLRGRWLTLVSLGVLTGVLTIALYAVLSGLQPKLTMETGNPGPDQFQPPVGFDGPYMSTRTDCVGTVTGEAVGERRCHGTWTYPLGTDRWGYKMTDLLIIGSRPILYATVVTIGVIVPLATLVGVVAGYYGGLLDDLLMSYVDVQLSVPAIVLYLIAYLFVGNSMFVLLVAFGLLSWGGIARIVRSETLQRREEGYVRSARVIGASNPYILRRHVLPNITNSIVPATFHLIAVLVLTEAALSFLGFHVSFQSWGMTIAEGLFRDHPLEVWWNSTTPALVLMVTVAAFKLAGDGLRDVLDPRGDHE
ncbi:ABC transporter permease [Natrialbaceae archaeon A-CW2]